MHLLTLPPQVKTWIQAGNVVLPLESTGTLQAAQQFITIKNTLVALAAPGVSVVGSSDSVTAGMDGVDRLTDKTKLVGAASGTAHSWIVLKWAALGIQLLFDFDSAGAVYNVTASISVSGAYTGGSITAAPTATDAGVFRSNASSWTSGNNVGRFNVSVWHSTDGKDTRVAVICGLTLVSLWIIGTAQQPVSGWALPFYATMGGATSLTNAQLMTSTFWMNTDRFLGTGPSGSMAMRLAVESFGTGANAAQTLPVWANAFTYAPQGGAFPICLPGLYCINSPQRGLHGNLCDIWMASTNVPLGMVLQDPRSLQKVMQIGGWVLPWSGDARLNT